MKLLSPLALFTVCGLLAAPLMAAEQAPELTGCAAKKHEISQQLEQARAHGNSNQVARREGISGIEEKAARKDELRDAGEADKH